MTRSETFAPFDIVAVPFPYTDRLAEKRRPALVVSRPQLQKRHGLVWVVMITSAENKRWTGDVSIKDHASSGLPAPSVVRPVKIAAIDGARIARRLGTLGETERTEVTARLREILA